MKEGYPSNKLDVAYRGDFEDPARTAFSNAQLPPQRVTLEDFAKYPFGPSEITSKSDYVKHVLTWFSKALIDAGYKPNEVDNLIRKSLDTIDFNRPEAMYVADINRIIQNFYKAAPGKNSSTEATEVPAPVAAGQAEIIETSVQSTPTPITPVVPQQSETHISPFAQKVEPFRSADDGVPKEVTINTRTPDLSSVSSVEIQQEEETLPLATEFDDRAQEYAEYGNRSIKITPSFPEATNVTAVKKDNFENPPQVTRNEQLASTPLILTPEMRVVDPNEPIVLETVSADDEVALEKRNVGLEYQSKLDALNTQAFNHEAYIEFVFDVHTGLRHEYDGVINSARNNLKRFDGFYAPSTIEKQALQLLSSLQGQYAKMQNVQSDYGLIRGALTEKLSESPTDAIEAEIKSLSQSYLDATQKLFANISKLEGLIEEVKQEEKPSVAEVYRAQFEKLQTEGNQVLRSLSASHPLYERLKTAVEVDLQKIIAQASVENGGDKAVLENSSNFIARRDQIKELISFIKKEQEYQDFFARARARVQKLESQFEIIPTGDKGMQVKTILAENIVKIKQALSGTDSQTATVGVLENLNQQKSIIEMLLRDSEESISSLPQSETVVQQEVGSRVLTDAELIAVVEKTPLVENMAEVQDRYQMQRAEIEKYLTYQREQQSRERFSGPVYEKAKRLAGMLHLGTIGKAAAVLLTLAGPAGVSSQKSDLNILGDLNMSAGVLAQPDFDYAAISEFLRTAEGFRVISETVAPAVSTVAPELPKVPVSVETVPGVILPDMVSRSNDETQDMPSEIFSDLADEVPKDKGIEFASPNKSNVPEALRKPYKINFGDKFWDINEGKTLAGKLPVMSQINPSLKQALIDRMRDKINNDRALRDAIGGFGKNADQLRTGELMNLDKLNELGVSVAADYSYLK
ncbi:hypothetical protein K2P47_01435 [Patescibacteria group bacterium]|nr:hypothetical protein [Patescibacteria group bacterium]